jgi:hypothetical protein
MVISEAVLTPRRLSHGDSLIKECHRRQNCRRQQEQ